MPRSAAHRSRHTSGSRRLVQQHLAAQDIDRLQRRGISALDCAPTDPEYRGRLGLRVILETVQDQDSAGKDVEPAHEVLGSCIKTLQSDKEAERLRDTLRHAEDTKPFALKIESLQQRHRTVTNSPFEGVPAPREERIQA